MSTDSILRTGLSIGRVKLTLQPFLFLITYTSRYICFISSLNWGLRPLRLLSVALLGMQIGHEAYWFLGQ